MIDAAPDCHEAADCATDPAGAEPYAAAQLPHYDKPLCLGGCRGGAGLCGVGRGQHLWRAQSRRPAAAAARARQERFGTKFNTAVNGFYKSLDDTFKSFTLTAENGLDQIRAQSIGGSTAKGE